MPAVGHIYRFIYMRHIKTQSKQFPQKLIIETCNYCNLKCVMCPYKGMTRAKTTMSLLLYRKIIDDAVSMGITEVTISGYLEPLLDKFLFERIQYAKSKGMRVGFSSNGTLLLKNDNLSNILNSHLDWIAFSVDGATKETYEKIRVGARFEDIVEGIGKLNQEKKKMRLVTPEIHLNCCVQEDNYEEVKTQRRKFFEIFKGTDIFEFGTVSTRGKEGKRLPRYSDFETPTIIRKHIYPCYTLYNYIYCLPDGIVPLCCIDYDGKIILGDMNVQTIAEIWESAQYQKIRQLHIEGRGDEMELCRTCKEFELSSFRWWQT